MCYIKLFLTLTVASLSGVTTVNAIPLVYTEDVSHNIMYTPDLDTAPITVIGDLQPSSSRVKSSNFHSVEQDFVPQDMGKRATASAPEPSGFALLAIGIVGMIIARRFVRR